MNVHAHNNQITWNIPYLVTLGLNFVMTAVFMCHINLKLGCICVAGIFCIKFGLLEPLAAQEDVALAHHLQDCLSCRVATGVMAPGRVSATQAGRRGRADALPPPLVALVARAYAR